MKIWILSVDTYDKGIQTYPCISLEVALREAAAYDIPKQKLSVLKRIGAVRFGEKDRPSEAKLYEEEVIE